MNPRRSFILVRRHRDALAGLTLVEAVVSVLLVALMTVAAVQVVEASAKANLVLKDQPRAIHLARQLLAEIMQCWYKDPGDAAVFGPEAGETRATYNDVDDFNGWSESPPQDSAGNALPGWHGWRRSVVVEWVDPANPAGTAAGSDSGLKRITVKVTDPSGRVTKLVGLRSQFGNYERPAPTVQTTYVGKVGITLQVGSSVNSTVSASVNPVNQAP